MQNDALTGHVILDLGVMSTLKGAHIMIEPAVREEEIIQSLESSFAVILLDVVIGYGAHPDPAGRLRVVSSTKEKPIVVASVTGTNEDPQGRKTK